MPMWANCPSCINSRTLNSCFFFSTTFNLNSIKLRWTYPSRVVVWISAGNHCPWAGSVSSLTWYSTWFPFAKVGKCSTLYKCLSNLATFVCALHKLRRKPFVAYREKLAQHMHGTLCPKTESGATKAFALMAMLIGQGWHKLTVSKINCNDAKGCNGIRIMCETQIRTCTWKNWILEVMHEGSRDFSWVLHLYYYYKWHRILSLLVILSIITIR